MAKVVLASALLLAAASCGYPDFDDNIPPTVPQNLAVRATEPHRVELTWDASEDMRGVEGYEVFRDSLFYSFSLSTGFADTGVSNATSYCYAVRAFDKDNHSGFSETLCDTTPAVLDVTEPTPPTNLTATAVSSTSIDLEWEASADDQGVYGYNVYDNTSGEKIGTSLGLSFNNTGLTPDTRYCYIVTAYDKRGNESLGSNSACEFTDP